MNILILGSGGREHTFAWKIKQSPLCSNLFIAPGNAGTSSCGSNININPTDFEKVKALALSEKIEMIVVGPEAPLVEGIFDFFQNDPEVKHIQVVGPSKEGAKLEGSKAFAKEFMAEQNIPTAAYQEFTSNTLEEGLNYISTQTPPIVLKADGLAAGKGVLICPTIEEAQMELKEMLSGKFGSASAKVVIEEFLDGIEFSVFVLTDGKDYKVLPVAKDYKRIGEGDTGLNTGGMGAVSPPPFVDEILMQKVNDRIIKPTIKGIQERGFEYEGFVFIGLIRVDNEPYVIEYNCRMGDPETEVVLPRMKNDLVELFLGIRNGNLNKIEIIKDERAATTVMLVSGGYPEKYEKGKAMSGFEKASDSILFHAGTKQDGENIVTNGGRVLALTSFGNNFQEALKISKNNAELIDFEGKYYRKDIGFDL
ncbi:MAG: phosphoribosylamine--glycine ligase [Bacteroidetes bacterium]|jgi:phosphoribosylamine--glycine ligase|nr:phosphoribosylamine--glycine ligase [Bacteroidota bacterium]MDF1866555.1 phosphoribosylamine--glycine ligase [Saprospiraceae bacterium]